MTWFRDFRPNAPSATTSSVATTLMKGGDFSEFLGRRPTHLRPVDHGRRRPRPVPEPADSVEPVQLGLAQHPAFHPGPEPRREPVTTIQFLNENPLTNIIWSMKFDHYVTDNFRVSYFHTEEDNTRDSTTRALPGPLGQGLFDSTAPGLDTFV